MVRFFLRVRTCAVECFSYPFPCPSDRFPGHRKVPSPPPLYHRSICSIALRKIFDSHSIAIGYRRSVLPCCPPLALRIDLWLLANHGTKVRQHFSEHENFSQKPTKNHTPISEIQKSTRNTSPKESREDTSDEQGNIVSVTKMRDPPTHPKTIHKHTPKNSINIIYIQYIFIYRAKKSHTPTPLCGFGNRYYVTFFLSFLKMLILNVFLLFAWPCPVKAEGKNMKICYLSPRFRWVCYPGKS